MKRRFPHLFAQTKENFFPKNPSPYSIHFSKTHLTHQKKYFLKIFLPLLLKQLNKGFLNYLLIGMIKLYQWTLGPFTQGQCRFYPSCSEYGLAAFKKYGIFKGIYLTIKRILKCNPWHSGGLDPLP